MTTLRTSRLELRPLADADAEELHDLFNDPDVGRYLLDGKRVLRDWVRDEIESSGARFDQLGCGLWAVRESSPSEPGATSGPSAPGTPGILGVVGFRHFFDPAELQLLYALRPDAWGRGLATEAAAATLEHAFRTLSFDEVRAATDEPNVASVAVLERLGMRPWKVQEGEPYRTLFYRLSVEDWASAHDAPRAQKSGRSSSSRSAIA